MKNLIEYQVWSQKELELLYDFRKTNPSSNYKPIFWCPLFYSITDLGELKRAQALNIFQQELWVLQNSWTPHTIWGVCKIDDITEEDLLEKKCTLRHSIEALWTGAVYWSHRRVEEEINREKTESWGHDNPESFGVEVAKMLKISNALWAEKAGEISQMDREKGICQHWELTVDWFLEEFRKKQQPLQPKREEGFYPTKIGDFILTE